MGEFVGEKNFERQKKKYILEKLYPRSGKFFGPKF
jgi:hypothetical protein